MSPSSLSRIRLSPGSRSAAEDPLLACFDTAGRTIGCRPGTCGRAGAALVRDDAPGESAGQGSEGGTFYPSELPDVWLGELEVGDIEAVAADLSRLGSKLNRPLHAILGQSFFEGRVVQLDYRNRRVRPRPARVRTWPPCRHRGCRRPHSGRDGAGERCECAGRARHGLEPDARDLRRISRAAWARSGAAHVRPRGYPWARAATSRPTRVS